MLIRFRFSNFRSLRDEQEFSMIAAFQDGREDLVRVDALDADLLRVAGIYGANAAGKSNVMDALRFMRDAVTGSHRRWEPDGPVPREPFLLDSESQSRPSLFEVDFLLEGIRYQYGFELDPEKVLLEWLYAFPKKRRQVWFTREQRSGYRFSKNLKGNNRALQALTRKNSLFLSVAAENNHRALLPVYSWLAERLRFTRHQNRSRQFSCTFELLESTTRNSLIKLLQNADLGIVDVSRAGDPTIGNPVLVFHHRTKDGTAMLPLESESHGTQVFFSLAGPILDALENRAVLCIDELDASLHPYLALEVIRIFQDPQRNPRNAQLIFNTHDTTLLGTLLEGPGLHRDQVWFVEKDNDGATHLYPLTDFKPRKFENLERGYLQGRYGAIPFIELAAVGDDA